MARSIEQKPWTPTEEKIRAATERIAREFDPLKVILFGSCARGDLDPDSDVDVLVVLDEIEDAREKAAAIRRSLRGLSLFIDIVVATPDQISRVMGTVNSVLATAVREGKTLYDRE